MQDRTQINWNKGKQFKKEKNKHCKNTLFSNQSVQKKMDNGD